MHSVELNFFQANESGCGAFAGRVIMLLFKIPQ